MRGGRGIGAGVAIVLVAFAFVLVRRSSAVRESDARADAERLAREHASTGELDDAPVDAPLPEGAAREAALAVPADRAETDVRSEPRLEVHVVAADRPAPGAELWFVDEGRAPQVFDPLAVPRDRDERLRADGEHSIADGRGRAFVAVPRGTATLVGTLDEAYGELALLAAEPGPVTLVLVPDPPVRVRVVDGRGAPAEGVPVALRTEGVELCTATTDARGAAVLHARARRAQLERDGGVVALALLLATPVEAVVDPARVEPVELVLPETGSVEIALRDGAGALWSGATRFRLGLSEGGERMLGDVAKHVRGASARAEDGRFVVPFVGLGLDLLGVARTEVAGDAVRRFVGPRTSGQRVTCTLAVRAPAPALIGRVLDAEGRPFGRVTLRVGVGEEGGMSGSGLAATREDGSFRWVLGGWDTMEGLDFAEVEVVAPPGREARARLDGVRLDGGVNDLGDVVLAPTPLLASGRVVDANGAPVRGVALSFFRHPSVGSFVGEPLPGRVATDALGRFALFRALPDALPDATIGIGIRDGDYLLPPAVFPVGAPDVELVVERGGRVRVRLLHEGTYVPNLSLVRDGVQVSVSWSVRDDVLVVGPVPPGTYSLEWRHPWCGRGGRLDGFVVRAGEELRDPRLDPLDLRREWSAVTLSVVDPDGAPVPSFVVSVRRAGAVNFMPSPARGAAGSVCVVAEPLPLELRVQAHGFRPAWLTDVRSDVRVELARGPRARLEIDGPLPELPPDWAWEGVVDSAEDARQIGATRFALAPGVVEVGVSSDGVHRFHYGIVCRVGGRELASERVGRPFGLEVRADGGVARIPAPDTALVAEARARVDELENE